MRNFTPILSLVLWSLSWPAFSLAENPHFHQPLDPERLERLLQHAAAKPALQDAGEPRTVRMIYFLSDPQGFRQEVVDRMKTTIREVQRIFADQIRAHGFEETTFRYEKDAQDEPMVHLIYGTGGHYDPWRALGRIHQEFDLNANVYFIVLGSEEDLPSRNTIGGLGQQYTRTGGWAMLRQDLFPDFVASAAHELGHAFGLKHNFNDGEYIMSYGPGQNRLSELSAGHLAVHPYFNPASPTDQEWYTELPTGQVVSSRTYPTDATSVPIRLEFSDPDGLQQVSLLVTTPESHFSAGFFELKTGRLLRGATEAVVDFEYDGIIPSDRDSTSLSALLTHRIEFEVVDMLGNIGRIGLSLLHESTHKLVIPLDRRERIGAYGVTYSPDGKILASGLENQTVALWNAETGEHLTTLARYEGMVWSLAFSPDGTVLATGTWEGTIKLWDTATWTEIVTLRHGGEAGRIYSLAFSPDGRTLASALTDEWTSPANTIKLWEVSTWAEVAELKGHEYGVRTVAFSPDGGTLASGAFDGTIRLWDVATGAQVGYIPYEAAVTSVAFSPDGKTLVSGAFNNMVAFWDVEQRTFKAQFEVARQNLLRYVSFTSDGGKVVSATQGGAIELWEADLQAGRIERVAAFQAASGDQLYNTSGAFSPDGTILATALGNWGQGDYTIILWDLSPYVTPVVHVADFNLKAAVREVLGKSDFGPLFREDMERLTTLDLRNREIRDLLGLEWATRLTRLDLRGNPLNTSALSAYIPALEARGVEVLFPPTPLVVAKLSDDGQQARSGRRVQDPLVVEVLDQNGRLLPGVVVEFSVTEGEGSLSASTDTTDAMGRASTVLTIGEGTGTLTVAVRVNGLDPEVFTVTAFPMGDFNGDGVTSYDDFFLFAKAFGSSDPRFDLDGNGKVGISDFFIFADHFEQGPRSKLVALARELIGLPESATLHQNTPNPFNSQTVISWFQPVPGTARLEVFSLAGQRIAVLSRGIRKAGTHRLPWDGRDDQGRPVATGVYLCRLVTVDGVQTRKLSLLR